MFVRTLPSIGEYVRTNTSKIESFLSLSNKTSNTKFGCEHYHQRRKFRLTENVHRTNSTVDGPLKQTNKQIAYNSLLREMDLRTFRNFFKDMEDLDNYGNFQSFMKVKRKWKHIPRTQNIRKRPRFNPLTDLDESQFREKYRYTKENMQRIIEMVRDDLDELPRPRHTNSSKKLCNQVPVEYQIMAAIRYWAFTEHIETTANAHGVSRHTLTKICKRVGAALSSKASRYIRMPATFFEKECVTNGFHALAGMPHVIGAIGHTCLQINNEQSAMEPMSTFHTCGSYMCIQVISDVSHKIRDLDCRLKSLLNEACISSEMFQGSRIKERFEQNEFRGRVLLGDERVSSTAFLFAPVAQPKTSAEYDFNRSHKITYTPVINCINLWRQRFQILNSEISLNIENARQTIVALALLHNMAIEWGDLSIDIDQKGVLTRNFTSNTFSALWSSVSTKGADSSARQEFINNNFPF